MARNTDRALSDELEVAQARIEGLIEDTREKHDIEFTNLTNLEILTLATTFHNSAEMFAREGSADQSQFVHDLDVKLREQAKPFFSELEEIHEPVMDQSRDTDPKPQQNSSSFLQRIIPSRFSPFTIESPNPILDKAWRLGMVLVLLQIIVSTGTTTSILLDAMGFASFSGVFFVWGMAVSAVLIIVCITFAMGIAYEKHTQSE